MANRVLRAFGKVLLRERPRIKSIVIEGHAAPDETNPWPLSSARAERVRALWKSSHVLGDVRKDYKTPIFQFLTTHDLSGQKVDYRADVPKIWDPKRFHKWHLQEYQAAREPFNQGAGVLPSAWVIASGRGDQVRRAPIVEFKIEYTERDAPPARRFAQIIVARTAKRGAQIGPRKGEVVTATRQVFGERRAFGRGYARFDAWFSAQQTPDADAIWHMFASQVFGGVYSAKPDDLELRCASATARAFGVFIL